MPLLGEYGRYRLAAMISRTLPRNLAYWVGLRLADRQYNRNESDRRAVVANLRHILTARGIEFSDETLEGIARKTFQYFGKYLVDFFRYSSLSDDQLRRLISVEHVEYFVDAYRKGRGVLPVTAHLGNWEMAGAAVASMGYILHAVVLPQRLKKVNEMFDQQRKRRGIHPIPLGNAALGIMRCLKRGEVVALLGDRDFTSKDDRSPFFGRPARIPRGPARLCLHTGAPIVPTFLLRQVDDTFLLRFYPPIDREEHRTEEAVMQALTGILEKEIGENPHQWFIFDNFWAEADRSQALRNTRHGDDRDDPD